MLRCWTGCGEGITFDAPMLHAMIRVRHLLLALVFTGSAALAGAAVVFQGDAPRPLTPRAQVDHTVLLDWLLQIRPTATDATRVADSTRTPARATATVVRRRPACN